MDMIFFLTSSRSAMKCFLFFSRGVAGKDHIACTGVVVVERKEAVEAMTAEIKLG